MYWLSWLNTPLPRVSILSVWLLVGLLGWLGAASAAEESDYLAAIEQETAKLGEGPEIKGMIDDVVRELEAMEPPGAGFTSTLTQAEFEAELQSSYAGTAAFYRKLRPGYQEEVYREYRTGASIGDVRELIMDRFLKH